MAQSLLLIGFAAISAGCASTETLTSSFTYTGLKTRIETPHYEQSLAFYTEILGLVVLGSWNEPGDRGTILGLPGLATGEAFLELAYSAVEQPLAGVSLQFKVDDLQPLLERVEGRWDYRGPESRPWGSVYLYLQDPSGLSVIIYQGAL